MIMLMANDIHNLKKLATIKHSTNVTSKFKIKKMPSTSATLQLTTVRKQSLSLVLKDRNF